MVECQAVVLLLLALFAFATRPINADSEATSNEKFREPFTSIYSDKEARRLWKVASSVYLINGSEEAFADCIYNKLKFSLEKYTQIMENFCSPFTFKRCAYFIAIDHNDKTIHISAEGLRDTNFHEFMRDRLRAPRRLGELLFDYFWNEMGGREIWNTRHRVYPTYRLVLTGHQTGGFVAQLIAYDLITNGQLPASQVVVRTFGTPKGFLSGFPHVSNYSNIYIKAVPNSFHITRAGDDVPRQSIQGVPGWNGPVKEVYYGQGMEKGVTYTICKSHDDPECSSGPGNSDTTMAANEVYFGHHYTIACFANDEDE